ncbi:MAG: hypothetical protein WDZ44_02100 [Candidatus Spechtbacterales bacterium]
MDGNIPFSHFSEVDMRIGTVLSAEPIEGSEKLLKLMVDFGEGEPRQILSGIAKYTSVEVLIGTQLPFVVNVEPREMMGMASNGMLLAAHGDEGEPVFLRPENPTQPGSKIG